LNFSAALRCCDRVCSQVRLREPLWGPVRILFCSIPAVLILNAQVFSQFTPSQLHVTFALPQQALRI
jgi:hypothetical protein